MKRSFKTADYEATLDVQVRLGDCLPPDHLACFVVDTIAQLDLTAVYARYGARGGQPYAPEILLGLLFYGYAVTDPKSRIMKNSTDAGFDQGSNVQVAVEQTSMMIGRLSLSNHPTDQHEIPPTVAAIAPELGRPQAAALDAGYFSAANVAWCEAQGIDPYIATGRGAHQEALAERLAAPPPPPTAADASPKIHMAYKLKTAIGAAIFGRANARWSR